MNTVTVKSLMANMGMSIGSESHTSKKENNNIVASHISQYGIQRNIVSIAAEAIRFNNQYIASGEGIGDGVDKVKTFIINIYKKIIAFFKSILSKIKGFLTKSGDAEADFEKALDGIPKVLSSEKKKGNAEDVKKSYSYKKLPVMTKDTNSILTVIEDVASFGSDLNERLSGIKNISNAHVYVSKISNGNWHKNDYTLKDFREDQAKLNQMNTSDISFLEVTEKTDIAHSDTEKMLNTYLTYKSKFKPHMKIFKDILNDTEELQKDMEKKIKSGDLIDTNEEGSGEPNMKLANFLQQGIQDDIRRFSTKINEYTSALRLSVSHIKELSAIYLQTNYSSYEL